VKIEQQGMHMVARKGGLERNSSMEIYKARHPLIRIS
jgi:hypothetical protein